MTDNSTEPEDLGEPQSYLVLAPGTPVWDSSGDPAGTVDHVLADDQEDIFHGLILKTADGHRYAGSDVVDGIFQHGVIISKPARELPEPAADAEHESPLRRAWDWLVQPR